jgi:hypothetical protein
MVDVTFIPPGSGLPEPTDQDALYFHASTRQEFMRQMDRLAQQRRRDLFVATEKGQLVATGLAKVRKVLSANDHEVELSRSHARHRWSPAVQPLPLSVGHWYKLAIDPASNEILAAYEQEPLDIPEPPTSRFPIDPTALPSVSPSDVEAFFSSVRRQPHIPFQYLANGCWARAHEMTRLIEHHFDRNRLPVVAKIWNFGELVVKTDNSPSCTVDWSYHVAPLVRVDSELMVIDPALCERPVTVDDWRGVQSDLSRTPIFTSQQAYIFFEGERFVGETEGKTESDLRVFMGDLISQVLTKGPLPYRCGHR